MTNRALTLVLALSGAVPAAAAARQAVLPAGPAVALPAETPIDSAPLLSLTVADCQGRNAEDGGPTGFVREVESQVRSVIERRWGTGIEGTRFAVEMGPDFRVSYRRFVAETAVLPEHLRRLFPKVARVDLTVARVRF